MNGVRSFRHRRSPSSSRFLSLFSDDEVPNAVVGGSDFTESEVLWTTGPDSSESTSPLARRNPTFRQTSGILAALPDGRSTTTPSRAIPKPRSSIHGGVGTELTQRREFRNSAPVNVPAMVKPRKKFSEMDGFSEEEEGEEEMLPPHEIVAMKLKTTSSSVLEGVGRTLKGRDLRQVRNAVWRHTGFLD